MTYESKTQKLAMACPFCKAETIQTMQFPAMKVSKICRGGGVNKMASYNRGARIEIVSGCSACGKTLKEVREAFESGYTRNVSHAERLKRLQEAGLPTTIVSERRG
jgi:hypothetical protein